MDQAIQPAALSGTIGLFLFGVLCFSVGSRRTDKKSKDDADLAGLYSILSGMAILIAVLMMTFYEILGAKVFFTLMGLFGGPAFGLQFAIIGKYRRALIGLAVFLISVAAVFINPTILKP